MRLILLFILFGSAPLFAAIKVSDPMGLEKKLGCRWSVFKFALEPVLERIVKGCGEIVIVPASVSGASADPESMISELRYVLSDLRNLSVSLQNDALSLAIRNVGKSWPQERLAFGLLTKNLFLWNSRESVYVPLRLEEEEEPPLAESGTRKKRAIKATPKRRPTMKATPKAKRGESEEQTGADNSGEQSGPSFNMPHVIFMKLPEEDDRVTEISMMGAVASSLVLHSEWVRIETWKARNLSRPENSRSPLFARFQENPKLAGIFKTLRSQSVLSAIYESQRPSGWKEIEKMIIIEAVNNGVYLAKELSDLYPVEKISKKNVFEYVDLISSDLDL